MLRLFLSGAAVYYLLACAGLHWLVY